MYVVHLFVKFYVLYSFDSMVVSLVVYISSLYTLRQNYNLINADISFGKWKYIVLTTVKYYCPQYCQF